MLLLDVFNILHAVPKAAPHLGGLNVPRLGLLVQIGRFSGEPAWLVCDGTGGGLAHALNKHASPGHPDSSREEFSNVRMLFAGPGKDADSLIEKLLDDLEHKNLARRVTVVSNDRRVQAAAVGVRARWISSDEFLRVLADDAVKSERKNARRTGDRPAFAAREQLDSDAAAAWLHEFGYVSDPPLSSSTKPTQDTVTPIPASRLRSALPEDPAEDRAAQLDPKTLRELEEWAKHVRLDDPATDTKGSPRP